MTKHYFALICPNTPDNVPFGPPCTRSAVTHPYPKQHHSNAGQHLIAVVCTCAGWWYKPDFIINDININSAMTSPAHDEVVKLDSRNAYFNLCGYAYSGAACDHPAFLPEGGGTGLLASGPRQASKKFLHL